MATEISSIRNFDIDLSNQAVQAQDILHLWQKTYSQNQITPPKENSLIAKRELKAVWILRCLDKFMEQENPDINKFVNFLQTKNTELNEYLLQVLDKMFVLTTKEVNQIKNYLTLRKLYSSSDMMQLIKYLCERCLARNQTKLLTKMIDFIQLEGKTQQYQVLIQEIYNKLALSHKFTQLKWEHRVGFLFVHKRSLQVGRLNHNLKRELSKYFSFF